MITTMHLSILHLRAVQADRTNREFADYLVNEIMTRYGKEHDCDEYRALLKLQGRG